MKFYIPLLLIFGLFTLSGLAVIGGGDDYVAYAVHGEFVPYVVSISLVNDTAIEIEMNEPVFDINGTDITDFAVNSGGFQRITALNIAENIITLKLQNPVANYIDLVTLDYNPSSTNPARITNAEGDLLTRQVAVSDPVRICPTETGTTRECVFITDARGITPAILNVRNITGTGLPGDTFGVLAGITLDANGNIYLSDSHNTRILEFDSLGRFVKQIGTGGSDGNPGEFLSTGGVAVNSTGHLFVVDGGNNRVQVFNPDGTFKNQITRSFGSAYDVAIGLDDKIYVSDDFNERVYIFNPDGTFNSEFGAAGTGNGQFSDTQGVAVNSTGHVYVADNTNDRIQIFDSDGNYLSQFGGTDSPRYITLDAKGNVYVTETSTHHIRMFDGAGNPIEQFGTESLDTGEFNTPRGIVVDSANRLYVADSSNGRIGIFDISIPYVTIQTDVVGPTDLDFVPFTVMFNKIVRGFDADDITHSSGTVQNFSYNHHLQNAGKGVDGVTFKFPYDVAINSTGFIFVTDASIDTVQILDSDLRYVGEFGGNGTGNGQFDSVVYIAIDSDDNIYVTDQNNDRIQKFSNAGTYLDQFGMSGAEGGADGGSEFNTPSGIAINSTGFIYVSDQLNHRVQIFDGDGTYQGQFGSEGSNDGQFDNPVGIAIDSDGNVHVADSKNNRIQVFYSNGTYKGQFGNGGAGGGTGAGELSTPVDIALDSDGNVHVVDNFNHRIQIFDKYGVFQIQYGKIPLNGIDGNFGSPRGITLDSDGNIYVADTSNSRVQKFTPRPSYTFDIADPADQETLIVGIPVNAAVDEDGNGNSPSNMISIDIGRIVPTVLSASADDDPSIITLLISESVSGSDITPTDFTISNVATPTLVNRVDISGSIIILTLSIAITDGDAPVISYVPTTNRITNTVGGGLAAFTVQSVTNNLDTSAPTVALTSVASSPTNTDPIPFIVRFSESITGFDATDITNSSGTVQDFGSNNYLTAFRVSPNLRPYNVAINSTDHVYTLTVGVRGTIIDVFDSDDGRVLPQSVIKSYGTAADQLRLPRSMLIDSDGDIYITDTLNARIQKFNSNFQYIGQFGERGIADGNFRTPDSIAINSTGHIFVTDFDRDLVNIFSVSGSNYSYLGKIGGVGNGTATGEFNGPRGIVIDSDNIIYIADSLNDRVQIFNSNATYQRQVGGAADSTADGEFDAPIGIALDSDNNIYVTELINDRVQVFDNDGTYQKKISGVGSGRILGEFVEPRGIAVASDDDVYVADSRNERIQKLSQTPTRYTFDIAGPTDQETLTVSIAADVANDAAALGNTPSNVISLDIDRAVPTVSAATAATSTSVVLTVSESVSGNSITLDDFTISSVTDPTTVSAVNISGSTITLTLSVALVNSDTPTVSYSAASSQISDGAGNALAIFGPLNISNGLDTTPPTIVSASVITPTSVVLTVSESVTGPSVTLSDFTIGGVATPTTVSNVVISGTTITLTLSVAILGSDSPTVSYSAAASTISNAAGNALEAFSTQSISNGLDSTPPTIVSATVTTTTFITLTVSESVTGPSITAGDFTIGDVATPTTVSTVSVSGTTITLTLSVPITGSDSPTVSYTSSSSTIDDAAGNALATFSDKSITNGLDSTPPTVISASATTSTFIVLTVSESVSGTNIIFNDFTIAGATNTITVIAVGVSGSGISLGLSAPILDSDSSTVSYTPSSNLISDDTGNTLAAFGPLNITNDFDTTAPTIVSAAVATLTSVTLTVSESVSGDSVTPGDFTISNVATPTTVSEVDVSGSTITLTLSVPITASDAPTVSYTAAASTIADTVGNTLATFSARSITNDFDPTIPTVTLATSVTSPTNANLIPFTAEFSETVTGFDAGDVDTSSGTVQNFLYTDASYQRTIGTNGTSGTGNGQFDIPRGITLDSNDNLYVADGDNNRIQIFDSAGGFVRTFGSGGPDGTDSNVIVDVALDSNDNVYVLDAGTDTVRIFSNDGTYQSQFNGSDTSNDRFFTPYGIALNSTDYIYISDTNGGKIYIFYNDGTYVGEFGESGSEPGQFTIPSAMAIDAKDDIYVGDSRNDNVQVFDRNGVYKSGFGEAGTDAGEFNSINGIDIDSVGNIYVTDSFNDRIQIFNSDGTFQRLLVEANTGDNRVANPRNVVIGSNDNIYISDSDNHTVTIFSSPPTYTFEVSGYADQATLTVSVPADVSQDGDGNTNRVSNVISLDIDRSVPTISSASAATSTSVELTISESVSGTGVTSSDFTISSVTNPTEVTAVDISGTTITLTLSVAILGSDTPTVSYSAASSQISDGAGNVLATFSAQNISNDLDTTAPTIVSASAATPTSVELTISESVSGSSITLDDFTISSVTNPTEVTAVDISGTTITLTLSVAILGSDSPTVSYSAASSQISDAAGNALTAFSAQNISNDSDTTAPTVTVTAGVSGSTNIDPIPFITRFSEDVTGFTATDITKSSGTIQNFTFSAAPYIQSIGGSSAGLVSDQFQTPRGIMQAADGRIYVSDATNHHVQIFDSQGRYLKQFGVNGNGDGEFNFPSYIMQATNGEIYVSDTTNNRIQVFDIEGVYQRQFGNSGSGTLNSPEGIMQAADGNIYVADTFNAKIRVFTTQGVFVKEFGASGTEQGEFDSPRDIMQAANGDIYVTDFGRSLVQVFYGNGTSKSEFGAGDPTDSSPSENGDLNTPQGIMQAADGRIYVVDNGNSRVQIFDSTNQYDDKFDSNLQTPVGIMQAANGNIYVTEETTRSVQIFSSVPGYAFEVSGATDQSTLTVSIPAGAAQDGSSNANSASNTISLDIDRVVPTISSTSAVSSTSVILTISESVSGTGVTPGDFTISDVATATTVSAIDISGTTITLTLSVAILGSDTPTLSYSAASNPISDAAGNALATFSARSISNGFDTTAPTVTVTASVSGSTNVDPIPFITRFSEDVTGFTATDITKSSGTIQNFTFSAAPYIQSIGGPSAGSVSDQFQTPRGIMQATDGRIYIVDAANHHVQIFDSQGRYLKQFGVSGDGDGEFDFPSYIVQATNGEIYVSDTTNNRIQVFDIEGVYQRQFGNSGSGTLNSPEGIMQATDGNIYVADTFNAKIRVFNTQGVFVKEFGASGTEQGEFDSPRDIMQAANGDIYVTDFGRSLVQVFYSNGTSKSEFGAGDPMDSSPSENGDLNTPQGIMQAADGRIYVVDNGNSRVQIFDSTNQYDDKFDSNLQTPVGIMQATNGNIYVTEEATSSVQIFSSIPGYAFEVSGATDQATLTVSIPAGISQDGSSNANSASNTVSLDIDRVVPELSSTSAVSPTSVILIVSESVSGTGVTPGDFTIAGVTPATEVTAVDISGTTITLTLSVAILGSDTPTVSYTAASAPISDIAGNALAAFSAQSITNNIDNPPPLVTLTSIASDPTNRVTLPFIAEFSEIVTGFDATDITISSGTVQNFDTSHSVLAHYRVSFNPSISDVAVNSTGHVFVVDEHSGIINIINSTAHKLGQFGDRASGTGDGRFNSPRGIAINSNDEIYIVDSNNDRIQKFSNAGGFLDEFGSAGTGNSQFDSPNGIAINSTGYIFVVDTANDRVQIFDSAHVYQGQIGGVADGTGDGEFNAPRHIAIDSNDNIYVAGFVNDRVQIFDRGGTYQRVIGGTLNSTAEGQFNGPYGIALDSNDNIYVSDNINDRVQIFNNDGTYKRLLGNTNSFDGPRGIAIDSDSNIYIANRDDDRVSIFTISPTYTFDITNSTDQTTLTVSIPAGAAQDDDAIDNIPSNIISLDVDRVEPVISSAIVTNSTAVTLTTSEPVFSTNPRTTDFTIGNVDSSPRISTVVVSGDTITLKLYSQIKDSDVAPTVSYIPTFRIADAADNQLAAFDAQPITNNLDTTAPTVVSATAVSATSVVIILSEPVSGSNIVPTDFRIFGIPSPRIITTAIDISGDTITLTLSRSLVDSDTPSLTYTAASGPISDAAGHTLGTIDILSVTNNLDNTIPTVTVSTTVRSPTALDTIPFTVRLNEEISGFDVSDIIVSSGTVQDLTPVSISSSLSTVLLYTFNVVNPADQTTLTVSIPAGAVQDDSGNSNTVSSTITIDTDRTAPVLSSAATTSTTTIALTISEPVSGTGITPTDFTISGVATSTAVSSVDVSGSTITLTLSVPILDSDSPTVSYTAASNPISDAVGNTFAAFGAQSVSNNLDTTAPTVTSASAEFPTFVTLTVSEPVSGNNITPTDFTISGVATSPTVSSVDVFGTTITLTLSDPIIGSDTPTVSYTAASNPISDAAGNVLGTISSQSVSINLEAAPPIVTSAVAASTTSVVLTISEPVSGNNIAPSDFRIFGIPSPPTVVTAVEISGNTITLTLSIPLIDSTTPSVTYTAASGPISNTEGRALGTISSQSVTNNLDTTIPTVTVSTIIRSPTALDTIPFTVRLNEPISGFDVSDIIVSSGTVQDLTPVSISSSLSTVLLYTFNVVNPADQTTLTVSIPAGAVQDGSGNSNTVSSTITIDTDRTAPVLSSAIAVSTTTIALTLSEFVSETGITPTDFTIGGVATQTAVSAVDISGGIIVLTLSVAIIDSDSPTVSYTASSSTISDAAGSALAAFGPQSVSINLDTTPPTVTSASAVSPTSVILTISEPVSGNNITPTDFTISGVAAPTTVSAVDVSVTIITLTLSVPITGSDTPTVSYTASSNPISDAAGNALGTISSQSVSINLEITPPTVTSAVAATSTSVVLTISEPVSGSNIAPTDFRIFGIPSPPTAVTAVEISGNTITLTLSIPLIDSTTPSVTYTAASGPISDAEGHALGTISSQSVTNNLDTTIPTVTVSTTIRSPTALDTIPFTVRLNEEISGFDVSDIIVSSGTVQDLTPVSLSPSSTVLLYTFNVVNPADQTTLTVSIPAGAVQDGSGNSNTVPSTITIDIDRIIPVLSSAAATSTTTIALTISQSVSGTGITPTDFTIGGVATPTTVSTVDVSGSTITLTLSVAIIDSDSPTVSYTAASNPISNAAGHVLAAFGPQSVSNNLDTTAPAVTSAIAVTTTTVVLTISEPISGDNIATTDFRILGIPSPPTTVTTVEISGNIIILTLSRPLAESETPSLTYTATSGPISDAAGNALGTISSQSVSINLDTTPPTVTAASAVTSTSVTLTISEFVFGIGVTPGDFTIGDVATPTTVSAVDVSGGTITLTLSVPIIGSDSPTVSYTSSSSTIDDVAGNALESFTDQSIINNSDTTAPTVIIATSATDPTNTEPVPFTLTFSEQVTGFAAGDITISSGTVQNLSPTPSQSITSYRFTVAGPTNGSVLIVNMSAGAVQDLAGNANAASNTVSLDIAIDPVIPPTRPTAPTRSGGGGGGGGGGESIPPSLTRSFDNGYKSITINNVGISPDRSGANYLQSPPISVSTGVQTPIQIILYENISWNLVSYVELCMNDVVATNQACDGDTKLIWDKSRGNNNLEIVDPHNLINDGRTSVDRTQVSNNVVTFDFDIEFVGVMDVSDLRIHAWDTNRNALVFTVEDAIKVVSGSVGGTTNTNDNDDTTTTNDDDDDTTTTSGTTATNDDDSGNDTDSTDNDNSSTTSNTATFDREILKQWTGFASKSISDTEFLTHVGIHNKDRSSNSGTSGDDGDDVSLPSWTKNMVGKWALQGKISTDELKATLSYVYKLTNDEKR